MVSVLDLFEATTDGSCGIDEEQRVVLWNRAAEAILGYARRDVLGHHCYEIFRGLGEDGRRICQRHCPLFQMARCMRAVPTTTLCARTGGGRDVWLSVTSLLVPPPWRDHAALVHLFRDISSYKACHDAIGHLLDADDHDGRPDARSGALDESATCLTRREHEVLCLLAAGESTEEIAERLYISPSTVRNHIHNILTKLNVHSRLEAVTTAMRFGLL